MANEKRLIDFDKARESVLDILAGKVTATTATKVSFAMREATVDAAPVVHGHWIFGTANHREHMKCSVCLTSQTPTGVFTYCPNCGAKMDGGNEDV